MREYLFKGVTKYHPHWVIGWYCKASFGSWPLKDAIIPKDLAEKGEIRTEEIIPETLCEYTGVDDKNGVPIFVNDIVNSEGTGNNIVQYHPDCKQRKFQLMKITGKDITIIFGWNFRLTVIGNLHDSQVDVSDNTSRDLHDNSTK